MKAPNQHRRLMKGHLLTCVDCCVMLVMVYIGSTIPMTSIHRWQRRVSLLYTATSHTRHLKSSDKQPLSHLPCCFMSIHKPWLIYTPTMVGSIHLIEISSIQLSPTSSHNSHHLKSDRHNRSKNCQCQQLAYVQFTKKGYTSRVSRKLGRL